MVPTQYKGLEHNRFQPLAPWVLHGPSDSLWHSLLARIAAEHESGDGQGCFSLLSGPIDLLDYASPSISGVAPPKGSGPGQTWQTLAPLGGGIDLD